MAEFHNFRYSLAKKGKWICPECGHKTFVCYVDENGDVLDESVGKCDRADKCAHHYPPREYFKDNNLQVPRTTTAVKFNVPSYVPPSYMDPNLFKQSVRGTDTHANHLITYLNGHFNADIVKQMKHDYFIGTSKHWSGATVFWQVDRCGHIRAGKVMLYDPATGKRVKVPYNHVTWAHIVLNLPNFNLKQCLFGEHLLSKYPDRNVAIVESEKTAIYLSPYMRTCVFVATGGCGNLTAALCEPLRDRVVFLFPDNGKYDDWRTKGASMAHMFNRLFISDIMEREAVNQGDDLADYFMREDYNVKTFTPSYIDFRFYPLK